MPPRVLVIGIDIGSGHLRAGQAVIGKLRQIEPAADVHCIHIDDYLARPLRWLYVKGYFVLIRHCAPVWGWLYRHPPTRRGGTLPKGLMWRAMGPLRRLAAQFRPHVLPAPHPIPAEAACLLVERNVSPVAVSLVTDYHGHVCYANRSLHALFVGHEMVRDDLIRHGVEADRLVVCGIPVHDEFERPPSRREARQHLGLLDDVPVVLVMGGALGLGRIEQRVRELIARHRPLQIIAVAGRDEPLRRRLESLQPPPHVELRVTGYVDNVHELMAAADVFVSKPGGLSMTEAIHVGVPTVCVDALPGQEVANQRRLANAGCVRVVSKHDSPAQVVEQVLEGGGESLSQAAKAFRKSGSALAVAGHILRLAAEKGKPS